MIRRPSPQPAAFTLIELLVVIAIIGTLLGLLVPAVQKVREAAARLQCQNNLHQIGLALHNHHDAQLAFPPGYLAFASYSDGATDTAPGWGWAAFLLPYIEQDNLYRELAINGPVQDSPAIQTVVKLYLCPSDIPPGAAFPVPDAFGNPICLAAPTSYAACCGSDASDTTDPTGLGIFYRNSGTRMTDICDGTSNTILIGEKAWAYANGIWAGAVPGGVIVRGRYNPCQPVVAGAWFPAPTLVLSHAHLNNAAVDPDGSAGMDDFGSRHFGGSNFLLADGHVSFIRSIPTDNADGSYTADGLAFQALRDAGQRRPEFGSGLLKRGNSVRHELLMHGTVLLVLMAAGCGPARPMMAGGKWAAALRDPDATLRRKAAFTLGNIGPADPAVLPALLGALKDSDAAVRREAILALVKCGREAREAEPLLDELRQHDPDAQVRAYAGRGLEKLRGER